MKIFSQIAALLTAFALTTHAGTINFSGGDGTSGNPYIITTVAQLASLASEVNNSNATYYNAAHYQLANNLDLSTYGSGQGWNPIGTGGRGFSGVFDGNGKVITGLYINRSSYDTGLFGGLAGGTIKNLGLENVNITVEGGSSLSYAGAFVGYITSGTVANCYSTGKISSAGSMVGGIVGGFDTSGSHDVTNCWSTVEVSGYTQVGGIVGITEVGKINGCMALNRIITATSSNLSYFPGRVVGSEGIPSAFSGNFAFAEMIAGDKPFPTGMNTQNKPNGEDVTALQLQTEAGFPAQFKTSPWTYEAGKLPGLGGQTVEMPYWLKQLSAPTGLTATYGQTLANVALPSGWAWVEATSTSVGNVGTQIHKANFAGNDEYEAKNNIDVTITIHKATPAALIWPTAAAITYGATLSTSALSGGSTTGSWSWANGALVPTVANTGYEVIFTPAD